MNNISIDTTIRLVEIIAIFTGSIGLMIKLGSLGLKVGRAVERFELVGEMQGNEISALKTEVGALNTIITQLAVQDQKFVTLEKQHQFLNEQINELRHGEGYVLPLTRKIYPNEK